ncbi:protein RGF1 INDUCIBLE TRANSCRIPTION FACTOR 1-like [Arachis duranensis]|uniref:Protein RGF1 INDUCIBLE TRANSCRIPTION FACTOR 1-like n=1 Tax=Arachis duranensis TaxID=130453 RepID=A0A6P4C1V0_ARADU|nr:protein RGF1 INDUCIBLE TRANSCRIPTION FACTOR 1-like [Arachis duranensis]XP_052112445.1 protein RGF1 INDUCIBLE TRANSCRIPTION FACTOR 1-like [Arachis duranensis]
MKSTSAMVPSWLENLLSTRFFSLCNVHKKQSRNECKMFCLDCNNEAYCAHCIAYSHEKHRVVQIRRSSYHDVVRVKEIENALNITGIQTYRINGYQVFFLITRPINPNNKSLVWTKTSEKESIPIEGVSRTMLSQSAQLPTTAVPTPSNANSRKRKGTPCRAAS